MKSSHELFDNDTTELNLAWPIALIIAIMLGIIIGFNIRVHQEKDAERVNMQLIQDIIRGNEFRLTEISPVYQCKEVAYEKK